MPQPPHNPNPPKLTSSPPCNKYVFVPQELVESLSKYKNKNKMIQSPKIIHPIPSQDLPPKNAIMDSFSPVDPCISPSHYSLIPQDPFVLLNPSHDPLPNQDKDIPCTMHVNDYIPSQELASIDPPLH